MGVYLITNVDDIFHTYSGAQYGEKYFLINFSCSVGQNFWKYFIYENNFLVKVEK